MFEYGFLNLAYVNDDCKELKEFPEKKLKRSLMTSKGYQRQRNNFYQDSHYLF